MPHQDANLAGSFLAVECWAKHAEGGEFPVLDRDSLTVETAECRGVLFHIFELAYKKGKTERASLSISLLVQNVRGKLEWRANRLRYRVPILFLLHKAPIAQARFEMFTSEFRVDVAGNRRRQSKSVPRQLISRASSLALIQSTTRRYRRHLFSGRCASRPPGCIARASYPCGVGEAQ